MVTLYVLPALFALFVWWFSTGLIMYLDGLPRRTFKWSMLGATALLAASLWGIETSAWDASLRGAYLAFTWGLLAWGWQEIGFYMGFVTGPRRAPCPEGCRGWAHFGHAIQTSLWHELAIIACAIGVVGLAWGGPNQVGVWTFMVLWWMHQSAKLNVFLGVRNLNEEFLPEHLQFLRSFLTKKPMNLLFPFSITISVVILVRLVQAATAAHATRFEAAGFCFLSVLMGLAVLEHWLLVLPLPAAKLWSWSLSSRRAAQPFGVEVVSGFLGAGKTTFLRNRLREAGPKTVVLVNDFASVGIDGSLLSGQGADVVELPNGCICCSLRSDLEKQLATMAARYAPERVLIEPSGVADLASLVSTLGASATRPLVRDLMITTVIDAASFLADWTRDRRLLEAQARLASTLVVNKADLVDVTGMVVVETSLRALNPGAAIVPARFGIVEAARSREIEVRRQVLPQAVPHRENSDRQEHEHRHEHGHAGEVHEHGHGTEPFASWETELAGRIEPEKVMAVLQTVADGGYGDVRRLKGIAQAGGGWVRFDVAGRRPSIAAFAAASDETARVVAIGTDLDHPGLKRAFATCLSDAAAVSQVA